MRSMNNEKFLRGSVSEENVALLPLEWVVIVVK